MGLSDYQVLNGAPAEEQFYMKLKSKSPRTQEIYSKYIQELCSFWEMESH